MLNKYTELRIRLKPLEKEAIERVATIEGFPASGTGFVRWLALDWIEKKYPMFLKAQVQEDLQEGGNGQA